MEQLQRVRKLEREGEIAAALRVALEYWRHCRSAAVADAIDALTQKALRDVEPPAMPRKNADFQRLWCEQLAEEDLVRTGWLAQKLAEKLPGKSGEEKSDAMLERLQAIERIAPDPRIARAVAELFRLEPVFMGLVPTAELGHSLLEHIGDERTHAELIDHNPKYGDRAELTRVLERIRFETLSTEEHEAWHKIAGTRAKQDEAAARNGLFGSIVAEPRSNEPRAVVADWLMERSDPRGEFIMLQLREEAGDASEEMIKRAQELLTANKKAWLGNLVRATYRAWFRRGFLFRLELSAAAAEKDAADPMLATVEALGGMARHETYARFVTSPAMRSLREIAVWADPVLSALETSGPAGQVRVVQSISWNRRKQYLQRFSGRILPLLESPSLFPKLTTVCCDNSAYPALRSSRAFARLRTLGLAGCPMTVVFARWAELPAHITALRHERGTDGYLEIARTDEGTTVLAHGEASARDLLEQIPALPRDIAKIAVVLPLHPDQYSAEQGRLSAAELKRAAERRRLPLSLRKQPRRSGKVTGIN